MPDDKSIRVVWDEKKQQCSLKVIALPEKREPSAELHAMEMQGR